MAKLILLIGLICILKISLSETHIHGVVCPNKEECPNKSTCCELPSGDYGCCPYEEGVCCSDKVHCCPNHSKCDVESQTCTYEATNKTYSWFVPVSNDFISPPSLDRPESNSIYEASNEIKAPGGKCLNGKPCPGDFTCCPTSTKEKDFGCCPYKEAMCCADFIHCCPKGSVCNTTTGACSSVIGDLQITVRAFSLKTMMLSTVQEEVLVTSEKKKCANNKLCPLENAGECCDNFDYCCPKGTKCSLNKQCRSENDPDEVMNGTDLINEPTKMIEDTIKRIKCPDKSFCPDGDTCCLMSKEGEYGCCPYSQGTCCPDLKSCCPHGFKCAIDRCDRDGPYGPILIPSFRMSPSLIGRN